MRHPDFATWLTRIFERIKDHVAELAGISKRFPRTGGEERYANPIVKRGRW